MGRMLLAKVEARMGKDMKLSRSSQGPEIITVPRFEAGQGLTRTHHIAMAPKSRSLAKIIARLLLMIYLKF
jgi:hypothetical protein